MGAKLNTLLERVYRDKKVLVTGDTGFKGSWFSIWLNLLGSKVYGYSLPPESAKTNYEICSLSQIIKHKDGDIRDREELQNYVENIKPDLVFHLAAQPIVLESYQNPHYTFETNIMGTVNVLEAIRTISTIKAAVIITTDKVYVNESNVHGYDETCNLGGKDPYSASKACDELIVKSYIESFFYKESSCKIATARAGNVIGGGDWKDFRIIPDYFRAYQNNLKLEIRNPKHIRPWQHVLEPLFGYLLLGAKLSDEGENYVGAWNFGSENSNSVNVLDLISKFNSVLNIEDNLIFVENETQKETDILTLDISKAKAKLNWHPTLSIDEMVQFTVSDYLEELNNKDDIYSKRVKQIENFIAIAESKKLNNLIYNNEV